MGERDDELELSLRMGLGGTSSHSHSPSPSLSPSPLELRLTTQNVPPQFLQNQTRSKKKSSNEVLFISSSSSERNYETRPFLVGIDVNRAPSSAAAEMDDEYWISSPNSTVSSISAGKRSEREPALENENEGERTSCSRGSDDEDGGGAGAGDGEGRKKLRLSREQSMILEETFKEHSTLNPKQKMALAGQLNLRPRQVEVWFQNRRARTKLKQTEVDCEYLKRCCENLTQENQRLHKEVQELRALKLSPHLYMHMSPPTTLTMCPSCERVSSAHPRQPLLGPDQLQNAGTGPGPISPWAALQVGSQQPFNPPPPF